MNRKDLTPEEITAIKEIVANATEEDSKGLEDVMSSLVKDIDMDKLRTEKLIEVFKNNQPFKECLILQHSMNTRVLGENWITGENNTARPVDFSIASLAEIGEALESTIYPWWKVKTEDTENIITELIDVMHFELSKLLMGLPTTEMGLENAILTSSWDETDAAYNMEEFDTFDQNDKTYILNELIKKLTFYIVMPEEFKPENKIEMYVAIFVSLFDIFKFFKLTREDVISRYLIKNALNVVRSKNGYKQGKYIKLWIDIKSGLELEDNTVALKLIKDEKLTSFNEIEKCLTEYYLENIAL